MKQRVAYYSLVLLLLVVSFGLYQAIKQNKSPFSKSIETLNYKTKPDSLLDYSYRNNIVNEMNPNVQKYYKN